MQTKQQNKKLTSRKPSRTSKISTLIREGEFKNISLTEIDFSPLNYRKYFSEKDLQDFAQELKQHGIISPITVRKMAAGHYELVAGERRLRAARIAKLKEIPAIVKLLTDDEVTEIQLAENLQRENPHPLHEAQAIGMMQETGKNMEEIATRLGKSKAFVYSRIKLLNLIEPVQEMFLAEKISMQEAVAIAGVSQESQQEFFDNCCEGWEEEEFELYDLQFVLNRFKYDLREAPFDIKAKKLLPDAGACTQCAFNTATLKTLFPELAKEAVCNNKSCYQRKCAAQMRELLMQGIKKHTPDALLFWGNPSESLRQLIASIPEIEDLPQYNIHDVWRRETPEPPEKEDYTDDSEDGETSIFDEAGYNQEMEEYQTEMSEFYKFLEDDRTLKGLLIANDKIQLEFFIPEPPPQIDRTIVFPKVTTKQVQAAIKEKTATPELLESAIATILEKEKRAKELDREKVQVKLHEQFSEYIYSPAVNILTAADQAGARLIIYKSMDYATRQKVDACLFGEQGYKEDADLIDILASLTDDQFSFLIRAVLAGKSESKYPYNDEARCLYKMAEAAGVDVNVIEQEQNIKSKNREEKLKERIQDLEKRKTKMNKEA